MEKAQQEIDSYQRRLVAVREEIQELEVLYGEFSELGTALAAIDEYAAQAEGEPQLRVGDLGAQVGAAFDGRLAALRTIEREIERSLRDESKPSRRYARSASISADSHRDAWQGKDERRLQHT